MKGKLIERYILSAIAPYFLLSVVLLTAVLVTQQSAKFAEILGGGGRSPWYWVVEIMLAVLPNVLIFTLPMAMLIGTATGLSRIGSDGELTAMFSTGVGNIRLLIPVLSFAIFLSLMTFYVGFEFAPPAARKLRDVSSRAALYRLESPVEPRMFNTDLPGKIIYIHNGDEAEGRWEGVFIQWEENDKMRLITAVSGRIDTSNAQAELVLNDATIITIPKGFESDQTGLLHMTSERTEQFRLRDDRINSARDSILQRMRERQPEFDEMNWQQLRREGDLIEGQTQRGRDAVIALHKKLSLCLAPIAFAILGVGLGNKTGRGGRLFAVGLSLAVMIIYYLIALVGEQLARAGSINLFVGAWASFFLSLCGGITIFINRQTHLSKRVSIAAYIKPHDSSSGTRGRGRGYRSLALLDWMVIRNLLIYFAYTFIVMLSIFIIFTVFELLRFVFVNHASYSLVIRYLLFLLPYVGFTVAPLATLISVLITFVILVRRSELIAWWSGGESIYRILAPALGFALGLGMILFAVQENVLPFSNQRQNALRTQIKGGLSQANTLTGKQWLASPELKEMYSFNYGENDETLNNLAIYRFDEQDTHLASIVFAERGIWTNPTTIKITSPLSIKLKDGTQPVMRQSPELSVTVFDRGQFIKPTLNNPAEANITELSNYINSLKRQGDVSRLQMLTTALERKHSDPFSPLVMTIIGAPLALAFGRRGLLLPLFAAVLIGLSFWATTSGMQELGYNGYLGARIAAWGPPLAFVLVGALLLSRSRT